MASRVVTRKEQTAFWGQNSPFHLRVGIGPVTERAVGAGSCLFSTQGRGSGPAPPTLTYTLASREGQQQTNFLQMPNPGSGYF